ncbi:30S ribosomal protein S6-like isoform X3 [Panicum virgatum]|uniref:30S ribosomal protein S6-like isoform X3 n=1 Tax=Panicum virgatum TaxID=38727 RepID=UPI0019D6A206|nr:30S ribosomal protein S6-like isoform X3 [Panicum virgatum]
MEATAAPRALSLLAPSPPPSLRMNCWRVAFGGVRRRGAVPVRAKKKRGRGGDGGAEERVDTHSFAPKAGEAAGLFPEAVLLRKKMAREDGQVAPEFADAEEEKLYDFLNIQLESDLNLKRMRHYEVVYLIHEDRVEEVEDVVSKVQDFVREKKGRIWRLNNWGLRRLAYKIKKATHANYILMNFEIESRYINDFKTLLDKDERIIRHLVMKRDEAITEDCPPPPEFHTLRAQQYFDDEYEDEEEEEEEEDLNARSELESADYDEDDVAAGDEPEIIYVDEADQDNYKDSQDTRRRNRKLKVKKYTAEKVCY